MSREKILRRIEMLRMDLSDAYSQRRKDYAYINATLAELELMENKLMKIEQ